MSATRRLGLGLVLTGLTIAFAGAWIPAKAILAQRLIGRAWERALSGEERPRPWPWADTWPVARLMAPNQQVELFVLAGASGSSLAFGPGHWSGTALPGHPGHSVIAGHRDTHFGFLQTVEPGDPILITSLDGRTTLYRVEDARVVHERNPLPLVPLGGRSLALLTCFPFDAPIPGGPGRFLVSAVADGPSLAAAHPPQIGPK